MEQSVENLEKFIDRKFETISTKLQEICDKTEQNENNIGLILTRIEALEPQAQVQNNQNQIFTDEMIAQARDQINLDLTIDLVTLFYF